MDKAIAIKELCTNVEKYWQTYKDADVIPTLLLHDGKRWRWCPLLIEWESDADWGDQYFEAVRRMTKLHAAMGAVIAGTRRKGFGGDFFVTIQWRGNAEETTILWDIKDRHLVNRRLANPAEAIECPDLLAPPDDRLSPPAYEDLIMQMLSLLGDGELRSSPGRVVLLALWQFIFN